MTFCYGEKRARAEGEPSLCGLREQEIPGGAVPAALLPPPFGDYRQHGTTSKVQKTALTSWQIPASNKKQ